MDVFYFYVWLLIIISSYCIILYGYFRFSTKEEGLNNILCFAALFIVFLHVPIVLLLMYQDYGLHEELVPVFALSFLIPLLIIGLVTLISTIFLLLYRIIFKSKDISALEKRIISKIQDTSKIRRDVYRKIWHISLLGLFTQSFLRFHLCVLIYLQENH